MFSDDLARRSFVVLFIVLSLTFGAEQARADWVVDISILCAEPIVGATFTFSLVAPLSAPPCDPIACEPMVSCEIDCASCTGGFCPDAAECISLEIIDCINAFGQRWFAEPLAPGDLRIYGPVPFDVCIRSSEMTALPPGYGLPLTLGCEVNNVCNGTENDEQLAPATGFGFWLHGEQELPSPTPTLTATITPTETLTPTLTLTPTPAWITDISIMCAEPVSGGEFTFSLIDPVPAPPCDPVLCDPIVSCTISCEPCAGEFCPTVWECISPQIIDCINTFGQNWHAEQLAPSDVEIKGPVTFDFCIRSTEMTALPLGYGLPLTEGCDVNNLCNGTENDEGNPMTSGVGFFVIGGYALPTRTPMPTATATPTLTPTATMTETPTLSTGPDEKDWRIYH